MTLPEDSRPPEEDPRSPEPAEGSPPVEAEPVLTRAESEDGGDPASEGLDGAAPDGAVPDDAAPGDAAPDGPTSDGPASNDAASDDSISEAPRPHDEANGRPTFLFFGIVAAVSLFVDVATKSWAEMTMNARGFVPLEIIPGHLNVILAYNRGGAWGLLQNASEMIRKPFFLGVSVAAILFIVSLYSKLHPSQKALKWGLPLVLGGALGNLADRITRSQVIDFIDYQGQWVMGMNTFIRRYVQGWTLTDHWPTFNVADIAICVGVGLMAVDMFTSRRLRQTIEAEEARAREGEGTPAESRSA